MIYLRCTYVHEHSVQLILVMSSEMKFLIIIYRRLWNVSLCTGFKTSGIMVDLQNYIVSIEEKHSPISELKIK